MNRRQAYGLAGLLTATVLTGGVAIAGLAHNSTPHAAPANQIVMAAPQAIPASPPVHQAFEEAD